MLLVKTTPTAAPEQSEADERPRALIAGADAAEQALIEQQLGELCQLAGVVADVRHAPRLAREANVDVVLLYLDGEPEAAMDAARAMAQGDGRAVVMLSRDRDPERIVGAMRAGVRDFAYLEQGDDVRRAIAALRPALVHRAAPRGTVIAVFSAKGGSGATTIATNLAGTLRATRPEGRTVLVDLDVQMGDAMVFLDLAGGFGWRDLIRDLPRLDDELLDRSLARHASGLLVVAETAPVEEAEPIAPRDLARALQHLREHADFVVVDGLRDFDDAALAALDVADIILLTFTPDVPSLKNASRCLAVFRRLGYGDDKVKLVVNRFAKRDALGRDAIADALHAPVHATIANDFPTVIDAINEGKLLADAAPRARVTRDLEALAALVAQGGKP